MCVADGVDCTSRNYPLEPLDVAVNNVPDGLLAVLVAQAECICRPLVFAERLRRKFEQRPGDRHGARELGVTCLAIVDP